jgi:hypothetical protein
MITIRSEIDRIDYGRDHRMGWMLVVAVVVLAALFGGWALSRPSIKPPPEAEPEPAPTAVVDELVAGVEVVRAAAEQAVVTADEARHRAESAEQASTEAEQRYLAAQWEVRSEPGNHLVQRAALDAYRRGELSVTQLNTIWEHAGSDGLDPRNVDAARAEYDRTLAETAQVRQEAHVAEVAAEVLAEETRIRVEQVVAASEKTRPRLGGLFEER